MTDPIPLKRPPLAQHEDIPPFVRERAGSIAARAGRIKSVLGSPAALPEMRTQARGELDDDGAGGVGTLGGDVVTFALDRSQMPPQIARLPVDTRGYIVPWFVDKRAPYINGNPDFRIMDGKHLKIAIRERRCWVCGGKIREKSFAFVAGPMCGVNRTSAEPPSHVECARWSARACPFLSFPKRIRDESNLPSGQVAGVGIKRNPGVVMIWICEGYETWRPPNGGILFELGEPSEVEWISKGRPATQAEVMDSVESGLPLLRNQTFSPEDVRALDMAIVGFLRFLPPLETATT